MGNVLESFDLTGRVIAITGAGGLMGRRHAEAVAEMGGTPVLIDLNPEAAAGVAAALAEKGLTSGLVIECDITDPEAVDAARDEILKVYGRIDGLVNNAANNPKMEGASDDMWRLENLPLSVWSNDLAVGLTGAFLCSRAFGMQMASGDGGVIVNIASDLALIGPDQRIYRLPGRADEEQPVKPISYSVIKSGLLGLTRYLATYWAERNVRVNALVPGGVYDGQDAEFVSRLTNLIPMGRMADVGEYKSSIVFLLSDASSYMTGSFLVMDGGRTAW